MKTALRVLAWNVALLLLTLVAVELAFGRWFEAVSRPNLWQLSIYRDVDWKMSTAGKYPRAEPARYRRDHYGFRGDYGQPGDIRLLVLGGSTTDERFIAEGETWTDVFDRCLAEQGRPTAIANAAVAGQSSRGHIRNFDVWLNHVDGLRPERVLVYLGVNERLLEGRLSEDDVQAYNESGLPLWLEKLRQKSALYALINVIKGNLLAWRSGVHHLGEQTPQLGTERIDQAFVDAPRLTLDSAEIRDGRTQLRAANAADLNAYGQRLDVLIGKIRQMGAEPLLVTQNSGTYRLERGGVRGDLAEYVHMAEVNAVTLEACRRHAVICLDLASLLEFGDGDFYDNVHTTPAGSRKVGQAMCWEYLKALRP
ncbi:GDSL-type esterase/lipase family protein [Magnetospirillum gryphiswaldense]|uniref:Lysophospholipase L1 and related esterases n=1 Tax=Magnetospirillum gryphiswaldense TaxID=55518 RepID=A4U2V0_9PROT|nr:GDSL-type esterase/lipase family protein [Magnetospirillum gryphiswaldense]AVM75621.1 hypothetical protein MSR1_31550 [Magnetospirillum gryphiswaldense MSR-1]AVM79524.1 hypothetical protein MSR1L_31550 [Magnetospirillum gryphiswaldense]CAM77207.1 Lysophospholipase L1 and related esterases [Magnetospirillum gryphiswaldense MSR-1]